MRFLIGRAVRFHEDLWRWGDRGAGCRTAVLRQPQDVVGVQAIHMQKNAASFEPFL
eukprot:COSAG06_NODE_55215_length_290_cov_1.575916_1_plen_55_part_01